MVLKMKDETGFNLLKLDKMDDLMNKLQEDEDFFKKRKKMITMPKCKDCKHFKPIDDEIGDCIGYEISGEKNASKCIENAFEPREKTSDKKE